ncbi:hypothetical protein N658DRAFT_6485 [Parathielavia hyrcaniae]|uniref:Uncharacterized protein n=1 Tax=Parathielavia hyrcaniae TaxID=113614 RepID=A0AAN6QAQ9_9PEZI|nr:hypothetical protein N658DRAFT_6485 [Parathielavia hyrcaniae]
MPEQRKRALLYPPGLPRTTARLGVSLETGPSVPEQPGRASQNVRRAYETAPDGESTVSEGVRPGMPAHQEAVQRF